MSAAALGEGVAPGFRGYELLARPRDAGFARPALRWKQAGGGAVECILCPNACVLSKGERGVCRARENRGGALHTLVYGRIAAAHVDPVEKKPLFHFLPGSRAFSVATAGCNLSCKFCQNWEISQSKPEDVDAEWMPPGDLAEKAARSGSAMIAFTYNEPTVQYEYIMDASLAARARGIRSAIISNGYINPAAGLELASRLDAVKIDLKAFTDKFYRDVCGGSLAAVLRNLEAVRKSGKWLEIVVLVIPTLNDSPGEIREMSRWVSRNLSPDVPVHFTRFHAMYLIRNLPPTPVATLERCREIARAEGVRYPYVGNVPGHRWENTFCHRCAREVISRSGFFHVESSLKRGTCPHCGALIPGVWT